MKPLKPLCYVTLLMSLESFNISDSGINKFLEADWSELRKLDLSINMGLFIASNQLTDASLIALAARSW